MHRSDTVHHIGHLEVMRQWFWLSWSRIIKHSWLFWKKKEYRIAKFLKLHCFRSIKLSYTIQSETTCEVEFRRNIQFDSEWYITMFTIWNCNDILFGITIDNHWFIYLVDCLSGISISWRKFASEGFRHVECVWNINIRSWVLEGGDRFRILGPSQSFARSGWVGIFLKSDSLLGYSCRHILFWAL